MSSWHPYFRRREPRPTLGERSFQSDGKFVDFTNVPPPEHGHPDPVADVIARFDDRAAAAVVAAVGIDALDDKGKPARLRRRPPITWTTVAGLSHPDKPWYQDQDLSEFKWYAWGSPGFYLLLSKCLGAMAYEDYFPSTKWTTVRPFVSGTIPSATNGYCGTLGPGQEGTVDLVTKDQTEGNYDMNQQHLLPLAYRYYDELEPPHRERLIRVCLARGIIDRINRPTGYTSGSLPNDWTRIGYVSPLGAHKSLGETENHILMMLATRYLTNQLLYQRTHHISHDNRRNAADGGPSCFDLVLSLLRNILRDDFSEYNAKSYQEETRWALLNLCSFAYDHEVRLAARMVLDYLAARMAVSSSELRRMVPFRRRNEGDNVKRDKDGFMRVPLLNTHGADPMGPNYAIQTGNTRACLANKNTTRATWGIQGSNQGLVIEAESSYRVPPSVLDLFLNNRHRRFHQRLHRTPRNEAGGGRNVDNHELYAGSPSYLITAGGEEATYAIDPHFAGFVIGDQAQQLGVAVTTSFMPTTGFAGKRTLLDRADHLIQFGAFATPGLFSGGRNYGVAPDFACGHQIWIPSWVKIAKGAPGFSFADHGSAPSGGPGFYVAILQQDGLALMEAFDTWLHPGVSFADWRAVVLARNGGLQLRSNTPARYRTWNKNEIEFVIWRSGERDGVPFGARVLSIAYGGIDPQDATGDAGNVTNRFLNGTVLSSPNEAVIEIRNPFLGTKIRLDMNSRKFPRRTDEHGRLEWAGGHEEVWVDADWTGPSEGDVCRPCTTVAAAEAVVDAGGTVRVVPGTSHDRASLGVTKRYRIEAPIGGAVIGKK